MLTARILSVGQSNVFTRVCLSTSMHPLPLHAPPQKTDDQLAGGTRPTGMHPC